MSALPLIMTEIAELTRRTRMYYIFTLIVLRITSLQTVRGKSTVNILPILQQQPILAQQNNSDWRMNMRD